MEDRPLQEAREQINAIDREMARLFEQRMAAVARVAAYKRERGLPILDAQRERQVIAHNREYIQDEALRGHYARFMQGVMDVSKAYQRQWMAGMNGVRGTTLPVRLGDSSYDIILERGALGRAGEILRLNRQKRKIGKEHWNRQSAITPTVRQRLLRTNLRRSLPYFQD